MSDPLFSVIFTQEQFDALGFAFQRVGLVARTAADRMTEAFAAYARKVEKHNARQALAMRRREEQWHRKQRNDIRRQQLARNKNYFGRKRRARRARGRSIEWKAAHVSRNEAAAMEWVRNNVAPASRTMQAQQEGQADGRPT